MRPRFPLPYGDGATLSVAPERTRQPVPDRASFAESLRYALHGLRYAVKTQRNVRIQLGIGAGTLLLALALKLPAYETALVLTLTALVLCAELMNTALERLVDHLAGIEFDPSVKLIKDLAAGSVLVVCLGAAVVGAAVFLPHLPTVLGRVVADRVVLACAGLAVLSIVSACMSRRQDGWTRGPARVTAGMVLAGTALLVFVLILSR